MKMETKRPRGRPPKNGVTMTGAERARQFRQRQKIRDRERFLEIIAVIRESNRYDAQEQNHNGKEQG